jgi:protein-tyrosine phosphatase
LATGFVRLPLKNAFNARDLGGYPCRGGVTRWRTFVRADSLSALDEGDIKFLLEYGVDTIIDLRSADEIKDEPEPAALKERMTCLTIPLVSGDIADMTKLSLPDGAGFLPEFYLSVLQREHDALREALTAAAAAKGCALFHCAAGKDRTGLIAALLLGAVGVSTEDILANYEVTYTYIRKSPSIMQYAESEPQSRDQLYSLREYLEKPLKFITDECGGFEAYLSRVKLPANILRSLQKKLIEKA